MTLEEVIKAYEKCIKFRHKRIKTIPYNELDKCLYVVEKYIRWMEEEA